MATANSNSNKRKSFLSLTPVDFSLTAGTNIPAPPDSPPHSPANSARPPTAGGGPLSSHPPSQEDIPGAFPPTPEPEKEHTVTKMSSASETSQHQQPPSSDNRERSDSFATPGSPASNFQKPAHPDAHKAQSKAPRKLFSLGNLRQSFSSSRTSLHSNYQRPSTDTSQPAYSHSSGPQSLKRPSSPSSSYSAQSSAIPRPSATGRSRSGGNWFRRKSGMFSLGADNVQGGLDAVAEDQGTRPGTRDSNKRVKENHSPAPLLPEIGGLGTGGGLSGGDIGWNEEMFKK